MLFSNEKQESANQERQSILGVQEPQKAFSLESFYAARRNDSDSLEDSIDVKPPSPKF